jgi:hypothetical protein
VTGSLPAHDRQRRLGDPERAEQVGLQLAADLGLGELLHHPEVTEAGVVDDDVERAEVSGVTLPERSRGIEALVSALRVEGKAIAERTRAARALTTSPVPVRDHET